MPPKSMSSKYEFILCEYFDYFEISKGINIKDFQEDERNILGLDIFPYGCILKFSFLFFIVEKSN